MKLDNPLYTTAPTLHQKNFIDVLDEDFESGDGLYSEPNAVLNKYSNVM